MTHSFYIKFGPLCAQIQHDQAMTSVAEILKYWLQAGLQTGIQQPDITFVLTTRIDTAQARKTRLSAGNGWLTDDCFSCWDGRGWESFISRDDATGFRSLHWECRPKNGPVLALARRAPSILTKLAHQHYFSYNEMLASTFLYRQLIPAIQVSLLERDATLIHSSAIRHVNGNGILVSGWGGSGKTSASSFLYMNNPDTWQYMSDDLAILDANGVIHLSPIPLNIFPYNTQQFPALKDALMERMDGLEKLHWRMRERLTGSSSVARRCPPIDSKTYPASAQLALAIHLQRSTEEVPEIKECSASDLANIAKNILSYELRHGWPTYLLANAFMTGRDSILPSPDHIAEASRQVLERACSNASLACVNVPRSFGPAKVSGIVEGLAKEKNLHQR